MAKELTPRQLRERKAYEAEKVKDKPQMSRAQENRAFFRRQAGWPPERVK